MFISLFTGCVGLFSLTEKAKTNLGRISLDNVHSIPVLGIRIDFPKDWKLIDEGKIKGDHEDLRGGYYHQNEGNSYYTRYQHKDPKHNRTVEVVSVWQAFPITDEHAKKEIQKLLAGAYEPAIAVIDHGKVQVWFGFIAVPDKKLGTTRLEGAIFIHRNAYAYTIIRYTGDSKKNAKKEFADLASRIQVAR